MGKEKQGERATGEGSTRRKGACARKTQKKCGENKQKTILSSRLHVWRMFSYNDSAKTCAGDRGPFAAAADSPSDILTGPMAEFEMAAGAEERRRAAETSWRATSSSERCTSMGLETLELKSLNEGT